MRGAGRGVRCCPKALTKAMAFWVPGWWHHPPRLSQRPGATLPISTGTVPLLLQKPAPASPQYLLSLSFSKIRAVPSGLCPGQAGLKLASASRFGWLEAMSSDLPCSFPWPTTRLSGMGFYRVRVSKRALFRVPARCRARGPVGAWGPARVRPHCTPRVWLPSAPAGASPP